MTGTDPLFIEPPKARAKARAETPAKKAPSKRARRGAGEGGLYQDARGYWTAAVQLPDGPGGKRRRKVIRRRIKEDALTELRKAMADLEKTGDLATVSPTVEQWMGKWLKIKRKSLKPNSWDSLRTPVDNYIVPAIGNRRLDKLHADDVRAVHDLITETKKLSSTTALVAHNVLSEALEDAIREGRVSRNACDLVDAPRRAVSKRKGLTLDQARTLLLSTKDPVLALHWSIALMAGLRQSERLGLTRDQIDLDTGIITVSWQLQALTWRHGCTDDVLPKGSVYPCGRKQGRSCTDRHFDIPQHHEVIQVEEALWLTRPKTDSGYREVPMPAPLHEMMRRYLETHTPGMHGLILTRGGQAGRPLPHYLDHAAWHESLAAAGLPRIEHHNTRHATNSLLHLLKVPKDTRIAILGHASESSNTRYTHVAQPEMVQAMDRLGNLLTQG